MRRHGTGFDYCLQTPAMDMLGSQATRERDVRRVSFYPTILVIVLLAASMLLAACGNRSESQGAPQTPAATPSPTEREYDLDATAKLAAEALGGEGTAAYAVLEAFDSGYSPFQIARAIDEGALDESGGVEGVVPAWPPGNSLSQNGGAARVTVASAALAGSLPALFADTDNGLSSRSDFEQMFEDLKDQEQSVGWLVWLLGTSGVGYSVEQITDYLDKNRPWTDLSPPTFGSVPIIRDEEGKYVEPELPSDWAWKGRNTLARLQEDPDFDKTYTVLVIGMVNAGYSEEQIKEAWPLGIGLCSTQGGSSGGDAAFAPCAISGGTIVPPATTTPFSPAEIVIEDVIPNWPPKNTASLGSPDNVSKLKSGEKVSLKLYPYLDIDSPEWPITSHNIVMEIEPTEFGYNIEGSWEIEFTRKTDDNSSQQWKKGDTMLLEGEFHSEHPVVLTSKLDLITEYYAVTATRAVYKDLNGKTEETDGKGVTITGQLDEDLEGDGYFDSIFAPYQRIYWDTFAGVEE